MSLASVTEILPGVFIGDQMVAQTKQFFDDFQITHVVNCTVNVPCYFPHVRYLRIPVLDYPTDENNEIMVKGINRAIPFIAQARLNPNNKVLIHCQAGVSRSCTIAAALVRYCCAESIDQAIALVVAKRPIAFFSGVHVNFKPALQKVFLK